MVKFGVMIKAAPYEEMAERGILVERLGFDSLWVPDHIVLEDYNLCKLTDSFYSFKLIVENDIILATYWTQ